MFCKRFITAFSHSTSILNVISFKTVNKKGSTFNAISRGCKKPGTCIEGVTTEDDIVITTSCCKTDLCNSSNNNYQSKLTISLLALVATILSIYAFN